MKTKMMYIFTVGCQMNVYDTNRIRNVLFELGYLETTFIKDADLIIVNTCTVREKAEQKVFSFLGKISKLKEKKLSIIVGVTGCVVQQNGKRILDRIPHVDFVFGIGAIAKLSSIVKRVELSRCKIIDMSVYENISNHFSSCYDSNKVSSFVTIMRGCNNFCTYCVVPYVRGKEVSRDPSKIIDEIQFLVTRGVKEIVLLGQNVNSYGRDIKVCSFVKMLEKIDNIKGIKRIRFITSHPKDLSSDLIEAFGCLDKLCHHLHLPAQSGDNDILKRMNRGYTKEYYIRKIEKLRLQCSDIAVTSDFIVGFPGETDFQFKATVNFLEEIQFDGVFVFAYSDRPNVISSNFTSKISNNIKLNRLQTILKLQNFISMKKNFKLVGSVEKILIETKGSYDNDKFALKDLCWIGRTSTNKIVYCRNKLISRSYETKLIGNIVNVRIDGIRAQSLVGTLL